MMPKAGGQYIYLREALGPLWGFLYGWTLFLVIQTGTIAAVGVAFGKFLGFFFPSISSTNWLLPVGHPIIVPTVHLGPMELFGWHVGLNTQNAVGILSIVVLSVVNVFGIRSGAVIQNIFTIAKTAAVLALIVVGIFIGRNAEAVAANFGSNFWHIGANHADVGMTGLALVATLLAIAQVGSMFSADSWHDVTMTAGEVKNPQRNLPLALGIGTSVVVLLYFLANYVYLNVLPLHGDPHGTTVLARGIQYALEDRVATAAMWQMFGELGGALMAVAILVSTFGCNNGLILAGARVYYAMARDGLFFRRAGELHPKYRTPVASLAVQAVWCCLLCLSGSYSQLLDYIIFAVLVFYILTIIGLFVLRHTRPDAPRPYRAIGYPVLPALYVVMALFVDVVLLRYKPQYTWPGLIIVLLGIPVYFIWRRYGASGSSPVPDDAIS
jgi:basic amino acid/polyamine antiporter, APA family